MIIDAKEPTLRIMHSCRFAVRAPFQAQAYLRWMNIRKKPEQRFNKQDIDNDGIKLKNIGSQWTSS